MDLAPQVIVAGLVAVFIISFSKGAFGGGLAVVGIPILTFVMDPVDAAVVLAPLLPLMDLATLKAFPPRTWSMPDVIWVAGGVFAGMVVGAMLLGGLPRHLSAALIGVAVLAFAARQVFLRPKPGTPLEVSPPRAFGWGALGGLSTFLANAGQPPVAVYLTRRTLTKTMYAGTMSAVFTIANVTRLPLMAAIGLDRLHLLAYSAAMIPAIPLGTYCGRKLHDRLDRERLFFCVYVTLLLVGAKLTYDGVRMWP